MNIYKKLYGLIHKYLYTTGVLIMTVTDISSATSFKLKEPQSYFKDKNTLALVAASLTGDTAKATKLVAEGADPNDEGQLDNPQNFFRPLHYAIAAHKPEAVKVLLEVGADPEIKTEGPGRPLMFAMTLNYLKIFEYMLDLKPVTTLSPETVKSLLFRSVSIPRPQCLEILLDHGVPIDVLDNAKYTILMRAMDAQDYDLAEWLLERGASVHIEAGSGATPANSVQFHLNKYIPGSPTYNKVLHLKKMMEERGAVFPAPSPAEVRARRTGR